MEIITGQQNSAPRYIPRVSPEEASQLFTKLYNHKVERVKSLPGYVTQNFYIQTSVDHETAQEYVLKICPFQFANDKELTEVFMKTMLYLGDSGIVCSAPVKNAQGDYITREEVNCCRVSSTSKKEEECITQSSCLIYTLTYLSGEQLADVCPKSVPLPWFKVLGQYLARVDKAMLDFPHQDDIPLMAKYGETCEWSLNSVPRYKALLHVVQDDTMRHLVESVIDDFDKEVVPKMVKLRKAMIYNDFNHNNIMVTTSMTQNQHKLEIIGIIDFNDMCHTCVLFEISIAMTYMMYIQKEGDRLASGYQFLQGYQSGMSLTDTEWELLPLCIAARSVQTILAGLNSHQKDPTNEYVLSDVEDASEVLKFLRSMPSKAIVKHWRGETLD